MRQDDVPTASDVSDHIAHTMWHIHNNSLFQPFRNNSLVQCINKQYYVSIQLLILRFLTKTIGSILPIRRKQNDAQM